MRIRTLALCAVSFAALAAAPGHAIPEDGAGALVWQDPDGAVIAYAPDFFNQYNALTALDMVSRVPGFQLEDSGDQRGLAGGFGNVLINGEQPAGKADLRLILRRIPIGDVERIELIRENIEGVDLRGRSRVVNVVTDRGAGLSGAWRARVDRVEGGRVLPFAESSVTSAALGGELTLGLRVNQGAEPRLEDDFRRLPTGELIRFERSTGRNFNHSFEPSLRFSRVFPAGHTLEIDARGEVGEFGFERFRAREDADGAPLDFQINNGDDSFSGHDVSADYTRILGPATSLTLTAVQRVSRGLGESAFFGFDEAAAPDGAFLTGEDETESESILRAQYDWEFAQNQDVEFALESAYNRLEGAFSLFEDAGAGFVEIEVPGGDATVEELRFDASAEHVWRPTSALTLESRIGVETSEISQSGDVSNARRLTFAKPAFTTTWTPDDRTQWRLTAQREVGQLNFGDFVASVDLRNEQTDFSNPELEPERAWILEAEYERRFGDRGSMTLTLGREWITAVEGNVPFNGEDAPGNLEDGRVLRADLQASLPLDRLGLRGALLEPELSFQDTSVLDPLTFETRPLDGREDWRASIDFRQDLPELGFSWGFDYFIQDDTVSRRIDEISTFTRARGGVDVFVETQRFAGLTTRIGADLVLDRDSEQVRAFFDPDRTGELVRVDERLRDDFRRVFVEVSGVF